MLGRYALDTNVAIAILNGEPEAVQRARAAGRPLLLAPVLGELLYGACKSRKARENEFRVRTLAASMDFIPCDEAACAAYGRLKAQLAGAGSPIPNNDLWVAACCATIGATLITRDAHFRFIPSLQCEEW